MATTGPGTANGNGNGNGNGSASGNGTADGNYDVEKAANGYGNAQKTETETVTEKEKEKEKAKAAEADSNPCTTASTTPDAPWYHVCCFWKRKKTVHPDNLTETANEERNWKSIAVALLVIVVICGLIVLAILLTAPQAEDKYYGRPFTFADVYNSSYQTFDIRAQWVGDILCYRPRTGDLMAIDPATNVTRVLLPAQYFTSKGASDYTISPNFKYVALKWRVSSKYRYSSSAIYTVYNLESKESMNIVPPGFDQNSEVQVQLFQWSTANSSDALIFVYRNNIYYKPSAFADSSSQITTTGIENLLYNGIPDWLYEEEIIGGASTLWWSQNGSIIAYTQMDDRNVTKFEMARYRNASQIYPETEYIPYPKAGEQRVANTPIVTVHLHNLDTNTALSSFSAPEEFQGNLNYIFTGAVWFDNTAVLIEWANRQQTKTIAFVCLTSGTCTQSLQVSAIPIDVGTTQLTGWVDADDRRFYPVSPVGGQNYPYITTALHTQKDDVYRQVSFVGGVTKVAGALPRVTPLSFGSEVDSISAVDSLRRTVYYIAPRDDDPKTAHLFVAGWTDSGESANPVGNNICLTCSLNETCDVVSARFSKSASYYLLQCSGPGVPATILKSVDGAIINVMETNEPMKKALQDMMMPRVVYQQVEVEDGRKLEAELMLPPQLNEQHYIAHPLFLYVYGGPESRGVMKRWKSVGWFYHLVTTHNIVIASVDGRGTSGRGRKNAYWLYRSLGTYEIRDQILAVEALKKLPYIDKAKVAVQGSSYGGYATLQILANASNVVPCGLSLAPVTDWAFYDSAYTERFMDLYSNNQQGYSKGSLLESSKVAGIKKGVLLLAHGTADDNVHMQQSLLLMKLLNDAEAQYDLQIYTDMAHNLRVGASGRQLTTKMINFLLDCYGNKT